MITSGLSNLDLSSFFFK